MSARTVPVIAQRSDATGSSCQPSATPGPGGARRPVDAPCAPPRPNIGSAADAVVPLGAVLAHDMVVGVRGAVLMPPRMPLPSSASCDPDPQRREPNVLFLRGLGRMCPAR